MMTVKLIHNPNAGDEDHNAEDLVQLIEKHGYKVEYSNIKKDDWKELADGVDLVVVAGGDGAVRKVCKQLLKRTNLEKKVPVTLLPMGTANNIANSLGLMRDSEELIKGWEKHKIQQVDIALVNGLEEDPAFFIEAFGFGVFPNLINKMKKNENTEMQNADENLRTALEVLAEVVSGYKARKCTLTIDGIDHSGNFLLVEVMNMPSIGPNLEINPLSNCGDGELEVIVISEGQREKLAQYVSCRLEGKESEFNFSALKGKDISIVWDGIHAHIDDSITKVSERFDVTITVNKGVLDFLV